MIISLLYTVRTVEFVALKINKLLFLEMYLKNVHPLSVPI